MANTAWFDEAYYLASKLAQLKAAGETKYTNILQVKAAIEAAGMTSYSHYAKYGLVERTSPNQYFNTAEYLNAKAAQLNTLNKTTTWNADNVALALQTAGFESAYAHFAAYGWTENVNPSNAFDVSSYLALKVSQAKLTTAEVTAAFKAAGLDPISHYQTYGKGETGISVTAVPASEQVSSTTVTSGTTGQTYTLTVGADTMTPLMTGANLTTAYDDVFRANATANSLETADSLDGGAGTDILNALFVDSNAVGVQPVLRNIEKIYLTDATGVLASSLDLTDATGVNEVWVKASGAAGATMTVTNIALATKVGVTGAMADNAIFTYKATDIAGSSDTGTLLVQEAVFAAGVTASVLGIESLNIVVSDDATTTTAGANTNTIGALVATNAKTITLTGSAGTNGATTIGNHAGANFTALTKFDASAFTGNLTLDLDTGTNPTAGVTILPSSTGTNTITMSSTAAIADTIKFTASNVSTISKMATFTNFQEAALDKLDLSAFSLAAGTTVGSTVVAVAGDIAGFFTGTNRVVLNDATDVVYVDVNGNGDFNAGSDLAVTLTGVTAAGFTAADLILS